MVILAIIFLILSASFHEFMHGWAAFNLGDPTAKLSGRLTINPIAHLDLIGSLVLPLMLLLVGSPFVFAYAKPVPINPGYFKNYRRDTVLTALAGPLANLIIALVFMATLKIYLIFGGSTGDLASAIVFLAVYVNTILLVFNLLPIPPLDGSKFFYLFLDSRTMFQFERMGFILLIAFLVLLGGVINTLLVGGLKIFFSLFGMSDFLPLLVQGIS